MEYVNLGNSNLKVSKVCLGCMSFGDPNNGQHSWTLQNEKSRNVIKCDIDHGINFFDTAMGYQNGTSEEYLGKIIKEFAKREDVVIATKIVPKGSFINKKNVKTHDYVEECHNNSLRRLQID